VIVGRGMVLLLLAHLSVVPTGWPGWGYDATVAGLVLVTAGQAWGMVRGGPVMRTAVPTTWTIVRAARP
jgi:hypothetical protein